MPPRWLTIALIMVLAMVSGMPRGEAAEPEPFEWQWQNPLLGGSHLQGVAYGNGRWVAVGDGLLLTSTDGVAWKAEPVNQFAGLRDVLFAGDQFVVVGYNLILTSPDGVTWTSRFIGNKSLPQPVGIAYGNGTYLVLSAGSVHRSTDGVTWAEYLIPSRQGNLLQVAFGAGRFVAVGAGGSIHTSMDGMRWSQSPSPTASRFTAVGFVAGKFLIGGEQYTLFTSPDGLTWKQETAVVPLAQPGTHFTHFLPFGEQVVGLYDSLFGSSVLSSTDGVTWELLLPPQEPAIYALAAAGGQLLGVGQAGMVLSSADGRLWTPRLGGIVSNFERVAYGNGRFVAIGSTSHSGAIYSSEDGASWTLRAGGSEQMGDLRFASGRFLAVGAGGTFLTSTDGIDWSSQRFAFGPSAIGYGNGVFVGLGAFGRGMISTDGEVWEASGWRFRPGLRP